jgi:RNA polymerase sigma-70 factor (ECF subfamily)
MDFEALANQHKDEVYRQMIRARGNREDAEDVLVEALLKAHRHLAQLRDSTAFRAWLATEAARSSAAPAAAFDDRGGRT